MKSLLSCFGVALLAGGGLAVIACSSSLDTNAPSASSSKSDERVGSIGLRLQPVFGVTVANVHYVVTAGNPTATPAPAVVAEGNLPTPGTSSSLSFGIPLPVGSGYYLSLSGFAAESPDTIKCTGAYGPFPVAANQSALINLTLTCTDTSKGTGLATVDVKTDACPRLIVDYAVAEPSTTDVGKSIVVHASARDLDNPAEVITYAWSIVDANKSSAGQFLPATAHDSSFSCLAGALDMRIKVTATNHQCRKSLETIVSCRDYTCGDGVVELAAGETCDWAAGPGHNADPTCPADCTKVCGDGNPEGDETCDPLPINPLVCHPPGDPAQCTVRTGECGDGFVTAPEVCDTLGNLGVTGSPLPRGKCKSDCSEVLFPVCGDGITEPGEECDAGTGSYASPVQASSRTCSDNCQQISNELCVACEQAGDCFASSDNCIGPSGKPFTPAQTQQCFTVMACIEQSNCLDGTGTLGRCYCGTLGTLACAAAPFDLASPGAPNGPCVAVSQAGNPGLTTNSSILGGLTNKSRPSGAAGQRLNCDKFDPVCAPLCGVQ